MVIKHYNMLRFVLTSCFIFVVFAANLPNNFPKCNIKDPNLNKCLTKSAKASWPKMAQGDKSRHLLMLDPLEVPFLHFPVHENLKGNVTEAFMHGLQDMKINDINMNLQEDMLDARFMIPRLTLSGNYDVMGMILKTIPIMGQGTLNFTIFDMESHLHMDYKITETKGKHYIILTKDSLEYNTTRMFYNLTNLFDGDEMLGRVTNEILNENWKEINREIGHTISKVFGATFTEIIKRFFQITPIEEMFSI